MNRPNILANLKKVKNKILEKKLCVVLIFISFFSMIYYFLSINNNTKKILSNAIYDNSTEKLNIPEKDKIHSNLEKEIENENEYLNGNKIKNKNVTNQELKVGIAFVHPVMFGNGIARMLSVLFSELEKYDKYDIYLITKESNLKDFNIDKKVKKLPIFGNLTLIKEFDETSNVKIYVLNSIFDLNYIEFYKNLGKKVIDIFHGTYLSSVYYNSTWDYSIWANEKLFDAFIQVVYDDYYVYKKLGFKNAFYIPNMYTFDPDETPNSNLTHKTLMVMGREYDRIKGAYYGIKAFYEIVKEIPDAILYFISTDYVIDFIRGLIKDLNLTNNVKVSHYTKNISNFFLNSSVLLCPSKSESFPMVMNEGKAHGLPIVAFNVSYSPSYQKGVILVDMLNYTQMAKEAIKLLNDYEYRKKKGMEAKLSLKEYSNKETANKWDRLFSILDKDDPIAYEKFQNYTFEKYYDEEKARERLESNYNFGRRYNKYFCCHTFNDLINSTYIENIKGCDNISMCKW